MKIGFIGLGNMATAIIGGMLKEKMAMPGDILGSARTKETLENATKKCPGIGTTFDNKEVAAKSDVLFLSVKPQFFPEVMEEIRGSIAAETLVISIAAGKTISYIEEGLGANLKIVRSMPNTPALVGEGCTGVCFNSRVPEGDKELALKLLGSYGIASEVPERLMDTVGAVSGSSPAYVFMLIEAMADAGVRGGMPRKQAISFAAQAVLGSAKLVLESGKHPGELKDMVCSPGGTTIEGLRVLEDKGFRGAVMEALGACIDKSKSL